MFLSDVYVRSFPYLYYTLIKLCYTNIMEYYSAIMLESVLMRRMNLEPIIQSEVRKRKTNIIY